MLTIIQQTQGQTTHSEINLQQFHNAKKKNELMKINQTQPLQNLITNPSHMPHLEKKFVMSPKIENKNKNYRLVKTTQRGSLLLLICYCLVNLLSIH